MLPPNAVAVPDYGLPDGFEHVYSGKVRDLFRTPDGRLLFIASDRISAYDWVLPTPIPDKGRILTAMSLWWFDRLADLVPHHVVSTDVPATVAGRATVCLPLEMFPVECVVRGYLTGSGLDDYRTTGSVCGVTLPPGLLDGSRLPEPVFTPATKAAIGEHDQNVDFEQVVDVVGRADAEAVREHTLVIYRHAEEIARAAGIVLADTKLEFGRARQGSLAGEIVLADEVLTPDSSRFWPLESWQPGHPQPSFDKQFVRDWLTSPESGWDRHGTVPPPPLPPDVVDRTRAKYVEAYRRLTGEDLA
jgi:phosphoribosylaminoimidazole-succinocarboxamide synthase